jgi:thiamine pyrophosphokinase
LGPGKEACAPYLEKAGLMVAADSGLLLARDFGLRPDYIIGDMDSLPDPAVLEEYDPSRVFRYPREKDYTDTELALRLAREKGCDELVIVGGGGGRMDHFLALYSLFHRADPPSAWLTDRDEILLIRARRELSGCAGRVISLFPVGKTPVRMRSRGLAWPLDGLEWTTGDAGISNVIADNYAEIQIVSGALLLMRPWGN